jgi:hypothetical protein
MQALLVITLVSAGAMGIEFQLWNTKGRIEASFKLSFLQ